MMDHLKRLIRWLFSTTAIAPPVRHGGIDVLDDEFDPGWSQSANFHFREDILDRLDDYFFFLKRMRKTDPDAYALYSKVGASVVASTIGYRAHGDALSAWWKDGNRPAFGATALLMADQDEKGILTPRFLYFQKMKRPWFVQPFKGDVYDVTMFYDNPDIEKRAHPIHYYIGVDADANMVPLRWLDLEDVIIQRRHVFTKKKWRPPPKSINPEREGAPGLIEMFVMITDAFENSQGAEVRVACEKGGLVAAFGVEMKRTAYFFRDRSSNTNKRIFHVVRPHERAYKSGKTAMIKFHFRGIRDFMWNGYKVHVTVPGLHHNLLGDLNAGQIFLKPGQREPRGMISTQEMADQISTGLSR